MASKIIGQSVTGLDKVLDKIIARKARKIANDPSHPLNKHFELLPSKRRYRTITCKRNRYKNSFLPKAVHALNKRQQLQTIIHPLHLSLFMSLISPTPEYLVIDMNYALLMPFFSHTSNLKHFILQILSEDDTLNYVCIYLKLSKCILNTTMQLMCIITYILWYWCIFAYVRIS